MKIFKNQNPYSGRQNQQSGFTLADLLVTIAVVIILQLLLIPAMSRTRPMASTVVCEHNLRQITMAWQAYSQDYRDQICPTGGMDQIVTDPSSPDAKGAKAQWCLGTVDSIYGGTNDLLIRNGLLFPYVKSLAAYKCPLDTNAVAGKPTVRSISMNCWMNPITSWSTGAGVTSFRKQSDISRPASTFVVIEENPRTINDGWLIANPANPNLWVDVPASSHDGGTPISFSDGHVEIKKWTDRNLLQPTVQVYMQKDPASTDLQWLQARATY